MGGLAGTAVCQARTGPPSEAELKDAIHNRGERPKAAPPQTKAIPILTCAFDGTDQWLTGDLRGKSLYGVSLYGHSFTGIDRKDAVTFPEQGEMRFTYFLKTPSPITARIRVEKGGTTLPFDVSVSSPVVGTPTEVRIPFSSFSQAYVDRGPVLAPGDTARMFYVFSEATDCGFRLDSLSLVEIRK